MGSPLGVAGLSGLSQDVQVDGLVLKSPRGLHVLQLRHVLERNDEALSEVEAEVVELVGHGFLLARTIHAPVQLDDVAPNTLREVVDSRVLFQGVRVNGELEGRPKHDVLVDLLVGINVIGEFEEKRFIEGTNALSAD